MNSSAREIRRIENALLNGEVVKVEPWSNQTAPLSVPAQILKSKMTREDQLKIANRIVELSNRPLEIKENADYIALKIEHGPNSNAVNVYSTHVSVFITSQDLLERAEAEGFQPVLTGSAAPRSKNWYQCSGEMLKLIESREALFTEIVQGSVKEILRRRPTGKSRVRK